MPKTEEQNRKIRLERKQKILDTALSAFAKKGFFNTSISYIAEKSGISKGLLYNYFDSKSALLEEIMRQGVVKLLEVFNATIQGHLTEENFEKFIDASFELLSHNRDYWKLYYSLMLQNDVLPLVQKSLTELSKQYFDVLTAYYAGRNAENPQAEALLLTITMDGLAMSYVNDVYDFPVEEMKKIILKKFK